MASYILCQILDEGLGCHVLGYRRIQVLPMQPVLYCFHLAERACQVDVSVSSGPRHGCSESHGARGPLVAAPTRTEPRPPPSSG